MSNLGEKIDKLKAFVLRDLWLIDASQLPRLRLFLLRQARICISVVHGFLADRCMLRASALTYATLLSIVPLLALMFAVLKGFGVQNALEPIILENLALGAEDVVSQIISYIDNTNVARLGVVGLCALLLAVLTLLSNIEKSFNHVWGVEETRPILRRFADYFSVITIGPLFVLAAISMTSTMQSHALVARLQESVYFGPVIPLLFKAIPFVGMWITFTVLYIFMPNTKVRYSAALAGGIFGGTLWQLAQWAYLHFQIGVGKYNAIYGTMAALPIFMVWLYVSWLIVLLGLEMTYAWQNLRTIPSDVRSAEVNFASRERVSLSIMLVVAEAFYRGEKPWDAERISSELDLPPRLAADVLAKLVKVGYLSEVQGEGHERSAYQPGRAPDNLPVYDLLQGLKGHGISYARISDVAEREIVRDIEDKIERAGREALNGVTLQDLVKGMEGQAVGSEE